MKRTLTAILLSLCVASVFGESEENMREVEAREKIEFVKAEKNIPKTAEAYAELLGCNFFMQPSNVAPLTIKGKKLLIALISVDVGCSGGNAMNRPVLVAFRRSQAYQPKMYIDPEYSSPEKTPETLPSTVLKIYTKNKELWYEARAFDFSKDALCCPSIPVIGKLNFVDGSWKANPITK